ncbi:MAP kinase-activating death domain protein-like isoform X6 [Asterias rubens]|uniref:MAP kinase-activating death domain protein-like isoform X6 n=1 Tax=Asterias rubens TaxID=7604 RepID=UPI001454EC78|nr:MAP kinase-activating death domain protein-like isoform X6 [Asterias rubens]
MDTFQAGRKHFCPRLLDYVLIVGTRHPNGNNSVSKTPELLRRYPQEDHTDFPLPKDVVFFCQPEGCLTVGRKKLSLRENTSFVFTLTDKDSGRARFGICVNFYRPFKSSKRKTLENQGEKALVNNRQNSSSNDTLNVPSDDVDQRKSPRTRRRLKQAKKIRNNSLTSLCILSHHPFISTFRECLFILKRLIDSCNERTCSRKVGGSKGSLRDCVWGVLTGICSDIPPLVRHDVRQIETWILRFLSAPVPVPGKTRLEIQLLETQQPMVFALPDHTRFSLADFPLHLPLELLGVDTCLKVLTLIMLENKVVLQSRDYNALSMSVMAFVAMIYPLEYMFPVIPLLPTCMGSAEQLLLAPTPFIIGVPASFFLYKPYFKLPEDVWFVDLDTNKITFCGQAEEVPELPEPEGSVLKKHFKQALTSMSLSPPPIKDFEESRGEVEAISRRRENFTDETGFNPFIYGNDVDSVDVATRVAMVKFFNSPNVLAHHNEHTRTLRLHPRPVVAFQVHSFVQSRVVISKYVEQLAKTQAVEFFGEFCLNPVNVTFLRIQTGVFDPQLIGDKSRWYMEQLQPVNFKVFFENCTLGIPSSSGSEAWSDSSNPTDESGEESDAGSSSSSSYSSLNDFVTDMMNSDIQGDVLDNEENAGAKSQVDETAIYHPPDTLQIPTDMSQSDSAYSFPETDSSSSQDTSTSPESSDGEELELTAGWRSKPGVDLEGDSDADVDSLQYDSDTPTQRPSYSKYKTSISSDSSTPIQPDSPRRGSTKDGHSSPTFLEKVNALFRSDSSDSSTPPTPTRKKPSLLKNIMDLALDTTASKEPIGSPTSVTSADPDEYSPSVRSDPGPYRGSSRTTTNAMGLPLRKKKPSSPFPRDTRRSLVERSSLIRHSSTKKPEKDRKRLSISDDRPNSDDQLFLKEITRGVLEGNNVGWLNWSRLKKLMQSENMRAQVISQLSPQENTTVLDDYIEDAQVSKAVYKGIVSVLKAVVAGLEHSFYNQPVGGFASAFAVLEIAHTHYFGKEPNPGKNKKKGVMQGGGIRSESAFDIEGSLVVPSDGVQVSESMGAIPETHSLNEDNFIAAIESWEKRGSVVSSSSTSTEEGAIRVNSPMMEGNRNDSAYELIDMSEVSVGGSTGAGVHGAVSIAAGVAVTGAIGSNLEMTTQPGSNSDGTDQLENDTDAIQQDIYKQSVNDIENNNTGNVNDEGITFQARKDTIESHTDISNSIQPKEIIVRREKFSEKICSLDSEVSEASTLVSYNSTDTLGNESDSSSTCGEGRLRRSRITHQSIRSVMSDSEVELNGLSSIGGRRRSPITWSCKSCVSAGFRYHGGNMIATDTDTSELILRHYVFEALIGTSKDRSPIWDEVQFWEDAFLDAVAAERDAVGMDQGPAEMIHRYDSLTPSEKKRLEEDEDKLLADILSNAIAFMVMMKVPKPEVKRKVRRLLGRSHIGLICSQEVNDLLDQINNLHGNDIDLKPSGSRRMRKHSFVVHAGSDTKGDVLFMEVCDDCVIIRSGSGAVCDRCWYERLINMTYCPKTKVLCLWRRLANTTRLDKFYTKKCRELYFCIKESMEKAATRQKNGITGEPELGGEFPIQDVKSGQGGLLQVTMEGVGLKFSQSKELEWFIELKDIKEYKTKKDIFMLAEYDPKQKSTVRHKFQSNMAHDIGYAMLCVFSYIAAAKSADSYTRKELEARMAGRRRQFLHSP